MEDIVELFCCCPLFLLDLFLVIFGGLCVHALLATVQWVGLEPTAEKPDSFALKHPGEVEGDLV